MNIRQTTASNDHSQWDRLKAITDNYGMSVNRFAKHLELNSAEVLYRIKHGKNGISRRLADRIVEKHPEISKGWLLTGEGLMFRDAPE